MASHKIQDDGIDREKFYVPSDGFGPFSIETMVTAMRQYEIETNKIEMNSNQFIEIKSRG